MLVVLEAEDFGEYGSLLVVFLRDRTVLLNPRHSNLHWKVIFALDEILWNRMLLLTQIASGACSVM